MRTPDIIATLVVIASLLVLGLWIRRGATPGGRARDARRDRQRSDRPERSFGWQAALIVLPVGLLAVLGLMSLRQDRTLAEQQARASAELIARQWARELGRALGSTLTSVVSDQAEVIDKWRRTLGHGQSANGRADAVAPPRLAVWEDRTSGGVRPALRFSLNPDGSLVGSVPDAGTGRPAPWLLELNPAERAAWYAIQRAVATGQTNDACRQVDELLTRSEAELLKANAEFVKMRCQADVVPRDEALSVLSAARVRFDRIPSETGFPLGQLAWLRALQLQSTGGGLDRAGLDSIASFEEGASTPLLPVMLQEVNRLARPAHPDDTAKVDALRRLVETRQATSALVADLVRQGPLDVQSRSATWVESGGTGFLAVATPEPIATADPRPAAGPAAASVWLLEDTLVRTTVVQCAAATSATLPRYARLTVSLAGRECLPDSFGSLPGALAQSPVLAEAAGFFDLPTRLADGPTPAFRVRVYLANAGLLYAEQRQRAWLFGGLIVAAAAAGLIGLVAAHRAFHRQLRLNEMKSNFVSSVSHELRAPIASIRLLAESLDRGTVVDEPKRRDYFRLMGQECRRLSALIENVLDFSRIDQGREQYEFEPTDLRALVAQTVRVMEPYASERQVTLRFEPPASFDFQPPLDGRAIQQALVNLIDNAVKHSPSGAEVAVTLAAPTARGPATPETEGTRTADRASPITLAVSDRGPGIPVAEHGRIFEPFYRRGSELRRETTGVGIGLTIVKSVVEAHGGRVRVESEVGQGSRLVIELPTGEVQSAGVP